MLKKFMSYFHETKTIVYSDDLFNDLLVQLGGKMFGKIFFDEWKKFSNVKPKYGRCASYKVPLFLGGEDDVRNLEDSDMEVYWEIMTQVLAQL